MFDRQVLREPGQCRIVLHRQFELLRRRVELLRFLRRRIALFRLRHRCIVLRTGAVGLRGMRQPGRFRLGNRSQGLLEMRPNPGVTQ